MWQWSGQWVTEAIVCGRGDNYERVFTSDHSDARLEVVYRSIGAVLGQTTAIMA